MDGFPKSSSRGGNTNKSVPAIGEPEGARQSDAAPKEDRPAPSFGRRGMGTIERRQIIDEARQVDFRVAVRGYDRAAVDRYVQRINRLLAELEISSSPESAVRHALTEVSEEAAEILRGARQTAEEVMARCRAEADDKLQQAEREAKETIEAAEHEAKANREAAKREAKEIREAAQSEARELEKMTAHEAKALRETAQREAAELRETTMSQMAELREAGTREAQQLRAAAQREAEEIRSSASRGATETVERAEVRNRQLAGEAEAIKRECRRLMETVRLAGEQLVAIGEGRRVPRLADELLLVDEPVRGFSPSTVSEPTTRSSEAANG
jgi:DivIVA domain-containing protein